MDGYRELSPRAPAAGTCRLDISPGHAYGDSMDEPEIHVVDRTAASRAVSVQMMAFSADPIMRWCWPEPHGYVRHFPTFVRGFGGRAFEHDAANVTDDFFGGSLWLPSGVGTDDDALERLFSETVAEPARSEAFSILEQVGAAHPKDLQGERQRE